MEGEVLPGITEEAINRAQQVTAQEAVTYAGVRPADCRRALGDCLLSCAMAQEAGLAADTRQQFMFRLSEAGLDEQTVQKLSEYFLSRRGRKFQTEVFSLYYRRGQQDVPGIKRSRRDTDLNKPQFIQGILSRERPVR